MNAESRTVSFSVTSGAFLTRHLRDMVLSHRWRQAFNDAKEMLIGADDEAVWSILRGEKRLQEDADGDMDLVVDDAAAEYLDQLDYMYGGVCDMDGRLYRASRIVTDYGPEDKRYTLRSNLEFIPESFHDDFMSIRDEVMLRAKQYKRNDNETLVVCRAPSMRDPDRIRPFVVIFEPAPDLPLWFLPKRSPQQAVNASIDNLFYTGHIREYGGFDPHRKRAVDFGAELDKVRASKRMATVAEIEFGRLALEQAEEAAERHRQHLEKQTALILQRNADMGYGMRSYDFGPDYGVREVPEGPLLRWAVDTLRLEGKVAVPEWKPISPVGAKMPMDNPAHTDWLTAAALLDAEIGEIQYDIASQIQNELLGYEVHVLAQGRASATGTVKICQSPDDEVDEDTIAVVPNAGIDYFDLALKAAAVIAVRGGATSHLALNGLDHGILIVRDPAAMQKFDDGMTVTVDGEAGTIRILPGRTLDRETDEGSGFAP